MYEGLQSQLACLQGLTVTHSDARFIPHLKKISRDIYDHLAEHLGRTFLFACHSSIQFKVVSQEQLQQPGEILIYLVLIFYPIHNPVNWTFHGKSLTMSFGLL
jgi:hypothetical protein